VVELPQLRQLLHERRDDCLRRFELRQRVRDDERLETRQRVERHLRDELLVEFLDVHPAVVGERHRRRAKVRRVGDREVDLVLGRDRGLERDAVRLGELVAVTVFDEVEALLLLERGLQVLRAAQQAGFALLADAALEHRFDEDLAMAVDQRLDRLFARVGTQHF
jgi:hypothetical protein